MTIKITAISGSVRPGNATSKALRVAIDELAAHPDVEVTPVDLDELDLPLPGLPARDPEHPGSDSHSPEPRGRGGNTHASFQDARAEFERAWDRPGHTRIETDAVDVNEVLRRHFVKDDGFRLTG